jgi:hypothetical protein
MVPRASSHWSAPRPEAATAAPPGRAPA